MYDETQKMYLIETALEDFIKKIESKYKCELHIILQEIKFIKEVE